MAEGHELDAVTSIFDRQLKVDDERDGCSIKGSRRQARSGSHEDVHPGSQADLHHPTLKQTSVTFWKLSKRVGRHESIEKRFCNLQLLNSSVKATKCDLAHPVRFRDYFHRNNERVEGKS